MGMRRVAHGWQERIHSLSHQLLGGDGQNSALEGSFAGGKSYGSVCASNRGKPRTRRQHCSDGQRVLPFAVTNSRTARGLPASMFESGIGRVASVPWSWAIGHEFGSMNMGFHSLCSG
jgi:hypothetical protein